MKKKTPKAFSVNKRGTLSLFYILLFLTSLYALRLVFWEAKNRPLIKAGLSVVKEDNSAKKYLIDIQYPQITGLAETDFQQQINLDVKGWAEAEVARFKKENAVPPKIQGLENAQAQLIIKYVPSRVDEKIVSFGLEKYEYSVGQAHGTTNTTTFNYSVRDKKKLSLADLFIPGCDCWSKLSQIARDEVIKDLGKDGGMVDEGLVTAGTAPKEENYRIFLLGKNSLILIFDPYQVAAGAAGTRTITLPFSKLRGILKV